MIGRYIDGRLTAEDGRHDLRALPYGELQRAYDIITPVENPLAVVFHDYRLRAVYVLFTISSFVLSIIIIYYNIV